MVLADILYSSILLIAFIIFTALAGVVAGEYRKRKRNKHELLKILVLMVWASLGIVFRIAFGHGGMVFMSIHLSIVSGLFVYFVIEVVLGLIVMVTAILKLFVSNIFIDVVNIMTLAAVVFVLFFLMVRFLIRTSPRK
jgi:hypothetical protein